MIRCKDCYDKHDYETPPRRDLPAVVWLLLGIFITVAFILALAYFEVPISGT